MDELKLIDGTLIELSSGASLGHLEHIADSEDAAVTICEAITDDNCTSVEFLHNDETSGSYENVVISEEPSRTTNDDGTVTVAFGLRVMSDVELRISTLEDEITEIQTVLVEE